MNPERAIELWGGVECTVNRVGETYIDQVLKSGHHDRKEDIARFAALGFHAMRYPVLWERVAPHGLATADWAWTDERLALLRAANIRPIATLLHHGSGPRTTHLLDPAFPEQCAAYAAAVAARYPWLQTIRLSMNRSRLPGSVRCMGTGTRISGTIARLSRRCCTRCVQPFSQWRAFEKLLRRRD